MIVRNVRRIDSVEVRFDGAVETVDGYRLYDAHFARIGCQDYGTRIEYRPPDEVEASFSSFELRPLTDLHPPTNVTTDTARVLARGATSAASWAADRRHAAGRLAVWDSELIARFDKARAAGRPMQLSAGYTLDLDPTPGTDPDTGERYDAIQRNIAINHVAAVPLGRAETAMVLDSAAWVGAIDLGVAGRLDSIRPGARVIVDLGRWARRDDSDLLVQQHRDNSSMKKLKIQLDGAPVEIEVADNATEQQVADAIAKATEASAKAKLDAAVAAAVTKAIEEKEKANADGKGQAQGSAAGTALDQAAIDKRIDEIERKATDWADALGLARGVLGVAYDGASKTADEIRLDVIGKQLGDDRRKQIEKFDAADRPGAIRLALLDVKTTARGDGPRALLDEIRAAQERRDAAKTNTNPTTTANDEEIARRALPRHARGMK